MIKPIWLICGDDALLSKLEKRLNGVLEENAGDEHCPPNREHGECGKVYRWGCCGCWAEWLLNNVEFVKEGE